MEKDLQDYKRNFLDLKKENAELERKYQNEHGSLQKVNNMLEMQSKHLTFYQEKYAE